MKDMTFAMHQERIDDALRRGPQGTTPFQVWTWAMEMYNAIYLAAAYACKNDLTETAYLESVTDVTLKAVKRFVEMYTPPPDDESPVPLLPPPEQRSLPACLQIEPEPVESLSLGDRYLLDMLYRALGFLVILVHKKETVAHRQFLLLVQELCTHLQNVTLSKESQWECGMVAREYMGYLTPIFARLCHDKRWYNGILASPKETRMYFQNLHRIVNLLLNVLEQASGGTISYHLPPLIRRPYA